MQAHALTATLILIVACAGGHEVEPADSSGPTILLVDSLVLVEPVGEPLGAYTGFFDITPAGTVVVSDIGSQRVVRFDSSGAYLGPVGRTGDGPGEFRMPAEVVTISQLKAFGVVDANRSRLLLFHEGTGEFLREVTIPFQRAGASVAVLDSSVVFAPLLSEHALIGWHPSTDVWTTLAPLALDQPAILPMVLSMGVPGVARSDSTLALWYPILGLATYSIDGDGMRRHAVPARRRQGEGVERIPEQTALRDAKSDSVVFSTTLGIGTLADGSFLLASLDANRNRKDGHGVLESDIRVYLTVVDRDVQRACVDGLVPLVTDASSIMVMHEGDPHFLARTVGANGTVRTVVYRYRVDVSRCDWIPISSTEVSNISTSGLPCAVAVADSVRNGAVDRLNRPHCGA